MPMISFDDSDTAVTALVGNLNKPSLCHVTCFLPYPLPLHLKTTMDEMLAITGKGCCTTLGRITEKTK